MKSADASANYATQTNFSALDEKVTGLQNTLDSMSRPCGYASNLATDGVTAYRNSSALKNDLNSYKTEVAQAYLAKSDAQNTYATQASIL